MARTAQLAARARMRILKNNQYGFSLIELLIVLLIVGIIASFSVYSVNLLDKHQQNSVIVQLKNQIQSARHKAQIFNFSIRIRQGENATEQQIFAEYFDVDKQIWRVDSNINKITLDYEKVNMDAQFIFIKPNGFITNSTICIDNECIQSVKK